MNSVQKLTQEQYRVKTGSTQAECTKCTACWPSSTPRRAQARPGARTWLCRGQAWLSSCLGPQPYHSAPLGRRPCCASTPAPPVPKRRAQRPYAPPPTCPAPACLRRVATQLPAFRHRLPCLLLLRITIHLSVLQYSP